LRGAKSNGLLAELHLNGRRKEIEATMKPMGCLNEFNGKISAETWAQSPAWST
jgi:hypothetical protein